MLCVHKRAAVDKKAAVKQACVYMMAELQKMEVGPALTEMGVLEGVAAPVV